jgi:hypothetical protein
VYQADSSKACPDDPLHRQVHGWRIHIAPHGKYRDIAKGLQQEGFDEITGMQYHVDIRQVLFGEFFQELKPLSEIRQVGIR